MGAALEAESLEEGVTRCPRWMRRGCQMGHQGQRPDRALIQMQWMVKGLSQHSQSELRLLPSLWSLYPLTIVEHCVWSQLVHV